MTCITIEAMFENDLLCRKQRFWRERQVRDIGGGGGGGGAGAGAGGAGGDADSPAKACSHRSAQVRLFVTFPSRAIGPSFIINRMSRCCPRAVHCLQ